MLHNLFGHFITITRHRHKVIYHCFRAGIPLRGLLHDLSKYSPTEFLEGVRFYQGDRSPNEKARDIYGYSLAWMHHKGRNKHHFEYWTDYSKKTHQNEPVKMPLKFVIEMFCDRVAASKIYGGKKYNDSYAPYSSRNGRASGEASGDAFRARRELYLRLYQKASQRRKT